MPPAAACSRPARISGFGDGVDAENTAVPHEVAAVLGAEGPPQHSESGHVVVEPERPAEEDAERGGLGEIAALRGQPPLDEHSGGEQQRRVEKKAHVGILSLISGPDRPSTAQPDFGVPGSQHRPVPVVDFDVDVGLFGVRAHRAAAVGIGVSEADAPLRRLIDPDEHLATVDASLHLPVPQAQRRAHPQRRQSACGPVLSVEAEADERHRREPAQAGLVRHRGDGLERRRRRRGRRGSIPSAWRCRARRCGRRRRASRRYGDSGVGDGQ